MCKSKDRHFSYLFNYSLFFSTNLSFSRHNVTEPTKLKRTKQTPSIIYWQRNAWRNDLAQKNFGLCGMLGVSVLKISAFQTSRFPWKISITPRTFA
ncbi:hypothetical protein BC938DRAFT_481219 [Jimgerdemannia flammicorona]|uniref:Uncharacterized protein n=1 Tax=Jimgerdemannia flammicorona TaxID=994334 RepID=A0A433QGP7_9FUNG|nr:hypothetical protein BC938DRAFT_481219 [Jimgerdemannia flammicorona]